MNDWGGVLTLEWFRDVVTNVVLLVLGGAVIWKLQDRWIRRRIRAEKDFEIQRQVYRQLSVVLADVSELRVLLPRQDAGDQTRSNVLIPLVTERAYRMADEARLLFDNTLLQAQFDLLTVILGCIKPGTVVSEQDLEKLRVTVFGLRRMLHEQMDFGAESRAAAPHQPRPAPPPEFP